MCWIQIYIECNSFCQLRQISLAEGIESSEHCAGTQSIATQLCFPSKQTKQDVLKDIHAARKHTMKARSFSTRKRNPCDLYLTKINHSFVWHEKQKSLKNVFFTTDLETRSHMCPWSTVISSAGIFVEIANNTLYGSNYTFLFYAKNH